MSENKSNTQTKTKSRSEQEEIEAFEEIFEPTEIDSLESLLKKLPVIYFQPKDKVNGGAE